MRLVIKLLPCVLLLTLGYNLQAQNENKKNVFSGHLGVSLPTNEFAQTTFDYDAGFATAGGNIELNYYRYMGKYFALNTSIGYTAFGFNESAYTNEYFLALNQNGWDKDGSRSLPVPQYILRVSIQDTDRK